MGARSSPMDAPLTHPPGAAAPPHPPVPRRSFPTPSRISPHPRSLGGGADGVGDADATLGWDVGGVVGVESADPLGVLDAGGGGALAAGAREASADGGGDLAAADGNLGGRRGEHHRGHHGEHHHLSASHNEQLMAVLLLCQLLAALDGSAVVAILMLGKKCALLFSDQPRGIIIRYIFVHIMLVD
ncbi:hypothetical protein SEVIR_3G146700v4 [Setaria viridis]|uniref:Uncharacterized protein n=1 Tax=Setaria viridis TaxID=4556 RepID=A0A4U6V970_SETVI|nr:hypothetical protein SEVIR_3G146700v2 [Setaria viridis]